MIGNHLLSANFILLTTKPTLQQLKNAAFLLQILKTALYF